MYLRQYVGSMGSDAWRNILRFVTGSSVCSATKIRVHFNKKKLADNLPAIYSNSTDNLTHQQSRVLTNFKKTRQSTTIKPADKNLRTVLMDTTTTLPTHVHVQHLLNSPGHIHVYPILRRSKRGWSIHNQG